MSVATMIQAAVVRADMAIVAAGRVARIAIPIAAMVGIVAGIRARARRIDANAKQVKG